MYDLYDRGQWFNFRKSIGNKILHKTIWRNKPETTLNTMKNEITYCSHPTEERFLRLTRECINSLFASIMPSDRDVLMVDQLFQPMNLQRYLRYFDKNIQTVVVDRDPRDVIVLDKYVWKDGVVPNDAELFCKWFEYTRAHRKTENMSTSQVRFIRFEDLVYKYEKTTKKLTDWLDLDETMHSKPKSRLILRSQKRIHSAGRTIRRAEWE